MGKSFCKWGISNCYIWLPEDTSWVFFQPKAYVAWKLPKSLQVPNQHDGWRQRQRNIPRASLRPLKYRQSNWHDGSHPCLVYKVFPPHWVTQTRLQPAAWHESVGSCRQSEGRSPARWNHWLWPFPVQWLSGKPNIMNHIYIFIIWWFPEVFWGLETCRFCYCNYSIFCLNHPSFGSRWVSVCLKEIWLNKTQRSDQTEVVIGIEYGDISREAGEHMDQQQSSGFCLD